MAGGFDRGCGLGLSHRPVYILWAGAGAGNENSFSRRRAGQKTFLVKIKTEKVRFFRPPTACDLKAIGDAERRLQEKWEAWETAGLIPCAWGVWV